MLVDGFGDQYRMANGLAQKLQNLQVVCVRLFELLDDLNQEEKAGHRQVSEVFSDSALAAVAQILLSRRRARHEYLPAELFSEPAWDMLLDLFVVHVEKRQVSVSSVCLATSVPSTTALRWLDLIEGWGLVVREASSRDRRVCYVKLSALGYDALRCYFTRVFEQACCADIVISDDSTLLAIA